jgi:hypothetical protein
MTEFLHEIVRERNFGQELRTAVLNWTDPWAYDEPIPYTLVDDIVHPTSEDLGAS